MSDLPPLASARVACAAPAARPRLDHAPVLDIDPFADAFIADPYAQHARLRDAGPVGWLERWGVYACARYDAVRAVLADHDAFVSSAGVGLDNFRHVPPLRPKSLLLEADPPAHGHARSVVARVLSPQALAALREPFAAAADALVEHLIERSLPGVGPVVDGVCDLAQPYALQTFPDAVGIQAEGREALLRYSDLLFNAFGPRNALFDRAVSGIEPIAAWIMARCQRGALAPGGLGAKVYAAVDAGDLSADEALLLVRSFLSAGLDTVIAGIGHALMLLAQHPFPYERLRADPTLARRVFDEALRLETPNQVFARTTAREVNVAGTTIPHDHKVLCFLGAANRDPRRWVDSDRFDIDRPCAGQLAFGFGIHACVGQVIARMEGELLLRALTRRVRRIELLGVPRWRPNNTLRALAALPLRLVTA